MKPAIYGHVVPMGNILDLGDRIQTCNPQKHSNTLPTFYKDIIWRGIWAHARLHSGWHWQTDILQDLSFATNY